MNQRDVPQLENYIEVMDISVLGGALTSHGDNKIHSCSDLIECVRVVGFLPLLESGIRGFSADALVGDECGYVTYPDGGWDWPLWRWKGPAVTDGDCVYGKFFSGKAGFVSREWWPDFCNWRRHAYQLADEETDDGAIAIAILDTLHERGSMVSRDLRKVCGLVGPKMRSYFDRHVGQLQMACRIVTQDFVYPRDKHGNEYGWGLSLLTTPEQLLGHDAMLCSRTPDESRRRIVAHLSTLLPEATERQIMKIVK